MIHEISADLIGAVGQPVRVLVVGRCKQNHCGVNRARANGEETGTIGRGITVFEAVSVPE